MKKCKWEGSMWFDDFSKARKSLLKIIRDKCDQIKNETHIAEDDENNNVTLEFHLSELRDINTIYTYLHCSKSILDEDTDL